MNLAVILSLLFINIPAPSTPKLLESWTVEMKVPRSAAEQVRALFLGGLSREDQSFYTADADRLVAKRSLLSGEVLWKSQEKGEAQGQWILSGDSVFGGDTKGFLYRIKASDGSLVWKIQTKGFFVSGPLVTDQLVVAMSSTGSLEAYGKEAGDFKWAQQDPQESAQGLWSELAAVSFGSQIIAGYRSGVLQSLSSDSGSKIWSASFLKSGSDEIGLNDIKSLKSEGEYLAASSYSGNLKVWKAIGSSQKELWEKSFSAPTPATFSLDRSILYICDRQNRLIAIETETGYTKWEKPLPGTGSEVSIFNDRIWVATSKGIVLAFNRNGDEISRTKAFEAGIFAKPLAMSETEVVIASDRGVLRRLQLVD